jgi:thioredoxin reductase
MQIQATAGIARIGDDAAKNEPRLHDAIVVGGGPAGVACALRLHQQGQDVLLLEAAGIGHQLALPAPAPARRRKALPLPPTGHGMARQLRFHLQNESVPHREGVEVERVDPTPQRGFELRAEGATTPLRARKVVLATGSRPRPGGFTASDCVGIGPGESMQRIDVQRKRVAILGGGDDALAQAVAALRKGAHCVHLYSRAAPGATPHPMRHILRNWIHVGPFAADPERMTVNDQRYDVFSVQLGSEPRLPEGLEDLVQDQDGCLCVDGHGAVPTVPGLYAIGDAAARRQSSVTQAIAQGIRAAKAIAAALAAHLPALPRPARAMPLWLDSLFADEEFQAVASV